MMLVVDVVSAMLLVFMMSYTTSRVFCVPDRGGVKMSQWTAMHGTPVFESQASEWSRSKLECAVRCRRFSHCVAFTFDPMSGMCQLFPVQTERPLQSTSPSQPPVFWQRDPLCQSEVDIRNGTTSWVSTLTSLTGNVTCDVDFMYTRPDTTLRCLDDGSWSPPVGQCLQYYWRNTTGDLTLPRRIFPGWSMCLKGRPTKSTKFNAGTLNTEHESVYRAAFLIDGNGKTNTTVVTTNMAKIVDSHPFPFRVGQLFELDVTMTGPNHTYSLTIDSVVHVSNVSSTEPYGEIVQIFVSGDVEVDYINLWCVT